MNKTWTDARIRSFVISALRGARWPHKFECINAAYVADGVNPKTGRKCKLHRCSACKKTFPKGKIQADHIKPVVSEEGFRTWDLYIERMFCGPDGFQALCLNCHADKTLIERFKIKPSQLPSLKALVAFRKMKASAQIKKLRQHKLPEGKNGAEREQIYRKHIKF